MPDIIFDTLTPSIDYFVNRKCLPHWKLDETTLEFHDLTYVYEGQATYFVNGHKYQLERGDLIYIPKGSIRQAYTCINNSMQCYSFNFQCCFTKDENLELPFQTVIKVGVFIDLVDLYKDFNIVWLEKSPGYLLKARALFMLILHKLMTIYYNKNSTFIVDLRIKKIKEVIIAHFNEKIEIEQFAELFELNPVYLGALFKKNSGCSFKTYINRIRINNAETLLSTGGYSVNDVGQHCGFQDICYFSKVFKKYKGYSPSSILKL